MMHIDFIEPNLPQSKRERAANLVQQTTKIIDLLGPLLESNPTTTLNAQLRSQLIEQGADKTLVDYIAFGAQVLQSFNQNTQQWDSQAIPMVGFSSDAFAADIYADPAIKQAIITSHAGRCAYCETLIYHCQYGDVEHFRPKAAYSQWSDLDLIRPGYHQLAYEPQNLLYACGICNQSFKQNFFPVVGPRFPEVPLNQENALFINPYAEDPRNFIRFNPLLATAYDFQMTANFYQAGKGWDSDTTAHVIWKDPTMIPGQSTTRSEVTEAFQTWVSQQRQGNPYRGFTTINKLGLNRRSLIRARASHLRQMRGLYDTAKSNTPDTQSAAQALEAIVSGQPNAVLPTPQYLSASLDALFTWRVDEAPHDYVAMYNNILTDFTSTVDQALADDTPVYNDSLMFGVPRGSETNTSRRYIIYLSDSDAIYGSPEGFDGWLLAIDWDNYLDNEVVIRKQLKSGERITNTTLREIAETQPQSLWRKFERGTAVMRGDFPPLFSGNNN